MLFILYLLSLLLVVINVIGIFLFLLKNNEIQYCKQTQLLKSKYKI